ncbi:MAG: homoserine dehydrogenase, partial [Fimbriimonadaceae bacterium]|nr:homoserine dehydrogenase [Chitinophagales bacterium]
MNSKKLILGLFGFGCVGQGLHTVLNQTHGIKAGIKKICIKHADKKRSVDPCYFTTDKNEILFDDEINVIVELIDDADAAFEIVKTAMQNGKAVVSANKKMIAEHLYELYELQQKYNVPFLYEGAVCASIPIIRNLEEYYDNDLLNSLEGIVNGSTNYILTKIFDENKSFELALSEAQELGFAETDPTLDIEGFDPKYKLCILLLHAFGIFVKPENIFNFGIQRLNDFDINYARQKNAKIKLIAKCRKINNEVYAYVFPHFVNGNSQLTNIQNEYNGVLLESAFSDKQFFTGKGAG